MLCARLEYSTLSALADTSFILLSVLKASVKYAPALKDLRSSHPKVFPALSCPKGQLQLVYQKPVHLSAFLLLCNLLEVRHSGFLSSFF